MKEVNEDEILMEHYFPYENISIDMRNMCLFLIDSSKEVKSSPRVGNSERPFDVVSMHFRRESNHVAFNGFISNGEENKFLDGRIGYSDNKYFMYTNVYRLYEYLDDDDRDYNLFETFELDGEDTIRISEYNDGIKYIEKIDPINTSEADYYYDQKVRQLKMN